MGKVKSIIFSPVIWPVAIAIGTVCGLWDTHHWPF
jgi:hypothetical protein